MSSTTGKTIENDNYQTPVNAVEALLKLVTLRSTDIFLEPCRGEERRIYDRIKLPEEQKLWAEISENVDYLKTPFEKVDVIITNIPFSLSEQFILKMMSELKPDGTLIFLQRVNFLGSKKRVPFWNKIGFPQKCPILVPRPKFTKTGTDSCEYCWFIYDLGDRTSNIPPSFSHIISSPLLNNSSKKSNKKSKCQNVKHIDITPIGGVYRSENSDPIEQPSNPYSILCDF